MPIRAYYGRIQNMATASSESLKDAFECIDRAVSEAKASLADAARRSSSPTLYGTLVVEGTVQAGAFIGTRAGFVRSMKPGA